MKHVVFSRQSSVISVLALLLVVSLMPVRAALEDAYLTDPDYLTASRAVEGAEDGVVKVVADPDATPVALQRAKESLQVALANRQLATAAAKVKVGQAVVDVLNTRAQAKAATAQRDLAAGQLEAMRIRSGAGAASQQELAKAKDALAQADATAATAAREQAGAEARLRVFGEIPETLPVAPPPALDVKTLTINAHPQIVQAEIQVAEAERQVALAGGTDTAPLDRDAKARALADAQDALRHVRRTQQDALDAAERNYAAAQATLALAVSNLTLMRTAAETARQRFKAGAIAKLALTEAEATLLNAEAQEVKAITGMWVAHYGLLQATGGAA
jgi:outer membrane protein TolC